MRSWPIVLFVTIAWTSALPAAEPPPSPPIFGRAEEGAIEEILHKTRERWNAPAIAAAVVRDDKIVYLNGVGVREMGSDKPVTADTLFAIGSCTKAFVATALAILVEEGKADWNDPVRKHLPWFRLDDPLADRDIRLCDLLCHRIGLARHDLLWSGAPWSIEESVRRMAFLEPSTPFRSTFQYSNLAYLAAGCAIEAIAKQPWNEVVRERLLKPLQIEDAVFTSGDAQRAPNHASPHRRSAGKIVVIPSNSEDKRTRASGSIRVSVRDLSQWLRVQLTDGKLDGKQVVSAAVLEDTHKPRIPAALTAARRDAGATQASYALGWYVSDYRGHPIYEHTGAVAGFRARIVLVPRKKLGLAVLTNLEEGEINMAAGNNLLDYLLGVEKKDWDSYVDQERTKTKEAQEERLRKRLAGQVRGTKAKDLELYAGTYSDPAYGTVEIARKNNALLLKWRSSQVPLTHFHYDTFMTPAKSLRVPSALRAEFVVFEMNEGAEILTLRFLGRKFSRVPKPNTGTRREDR